MACIWNQSRAVRVSLCRVTRCNSRRVKQRQARGLCKDALSLGHTLKSEMLVDTTRSGSARNDFPAYLRHKHFIVFLLATETRPLQSIPLA